MPTWFPIQNANTLEAIWQTTLSLVVGVALYLAFRRFLLPVADCRRDRTRAHFLVISGIALVTLGLLTYAWSDSFEWADAFHEWLLDHDLYDRVVWVMAAGLAVYLGSMAVQRSLMSNETDLETRHRIRSMVRWSALGIFILVALVIWITRTRTFEGFGTFLGLLGAGVALAFQETLLSIAGWFLILVQGLYDVGDRIEVNGAKGDVINITPFYTHVLEVGGWVEGDQSTGRILALPNSVVVRYQTYNYTRGFPFVWNEIPVVVTFESNWQHARTILLETAQREAEKVEHEVRAQIKAMQSSFAIHYNRLTPIVYTSISANGVCLTLRHLTPVRQRRRMEHEVSEQILTALIAAKDIDFAYPTTRIFRNIEEGKPEAGGPTGQTPPDLPPPRVLE